jgi:hypothetical protein
MVRPERSRMRTAHSHGEVVFEGDGTGGDEDGRYGEGSRSLAIRFGNQIGRTEEMVTNCLYRGSSSRALK